MSVARRRALRAATGVGLLAGAIGLLGALGALCSGAHADPAPRWRAAATGIEHTELVVANKPVHAFRIALDKARLRLIAAGAPGARRTVSTIAAPFAQAVAINASFFDDRDRAMGATVDQGQSSGQRTIKPWGALVVEGTSARIALGSELGQPGERPSLVVQGTPRLVVKGEIVKLKPQTAARTAVCAQGDKVVIVVTDSLDATVLALLLRDRLGCQDALNLDGGPSTQLSARLGGLRIEVPGGWGVPNALIALPGS
jgi:exopolysaccharide biosynthesis protein